MTRIVNRLMVLTVATALLSIGLGLAPAIAGDEGTLVNEVNTARRSAGKAPVQVYWDLTDDARQHSQAMKERERLYHNPDLGSVTSGWEALAENVGVGPDVETVFDAFMASSGHRSNILGPYNYIGVGGAKDDGKVWVTMVFMRGPDDLLDPDPTTTTAAATPTTTTAAPTTTTSPPTTTTAAPTTTTMPPTTTASPPTPTTTTTPPPTMPDSAPTASADQAGAFSAAAPFEVSPHEFAALEPAWVPDHLMGAKGRLGALLHI